MHKYFIPLVLLSAALCATTSCKHYCQRNPDPAIKLSGFDSADLNTVILRIYPQDGTFTNPVQTLIYTSRPGYTSYDTASLFSALVAPTDTILQVGYNSDASVELPALNKTWYIKKITAHQDVWKDVDCNNSMSYMLNGVNYTDPMTGGYTAFAPMTITK